MGQLVVVFMEKGLDKTKVSTKYVLVCTFLSKHSTILVGDKFETFNKII